MYTWEQFSSLCTIQMFIMNLEQADNNIGKTLQNRQIIISSEIST